MTELITMILAIFGILQIILFFKLWGMTNDVNEIKRNLKKNENGCVVDAKTAYFNGQKQIAQEILDKALVIANQKIEDEPYFDTYKIQKQQIIDAIEYLGLDLKESDNNKFKVGDLVVWIAKDEQMRIKSITSEGKYSCFSNGMTHVGDFNENEIKLFGE